MGETSSEAGYSRQRDSVTISGSVSSTDQQSFVKRHKKVLMGAAVLVVLVICITVGVVVGTKKSSSGGSDAGNSTDTPPPPPPGCSSVEEMERFDCYPYSSDSTDLSEKDCLSRGCCWRPSSDLAANFSQLGTPACYFPQNYTGYELDAFGKTDRGLWITLKRNIPSGYPKDAANVRVDVIGLNQNTLRIKFTDTDDATRFKVHLPVIDQGYVRELKDAKYETDYDPVEGQLKITRISTGAVVFNTDLNRLVFSNQFLQISTRTSAQSVYGIGEHQDSFKKDVNQWKLMSIFNNGEPPKEGRSLYGAHPFYLGSENDTTGNSHGVLLFNSNAMDVLLQPTPAITWRTIGGVLDFYIFMGPNPGDVTQQYIASIGMPQLPPYWSLGFHLCRYGYNSLDRTKEAFERTREAGIPFDVQWNDIDYMEVHNDFTYDKTNFKDLPKFIDELHKNEMHWIPILDPGVSDTETENGTSLPYNEGMEMDIFVKDPSGNPVRGKVWNKNTTVWVDFTHPDATNYWGKQLERFHKELPFDGIWIDMNEPANFFDGRQEGCPKDPLESPPYLPGGIGWPLNRQTLCMTDKHAIGNHYDVHNLYGFNEGMATNAALKKIIKERPFVLSRSTFVGSGAYVGHWTGDVDSSWEHMKWTIPTMLDYNMFGIPMVGADICGFRLNTTVELCARWSALGAFYPFSRNHNDFDTIDQDPAALGEEVKAAAKYALNLRYSLLPYLYTLFYRASAYGETVARPLFFEFPQDKASYEIETQFMWGSAIMIVPVLEPNTVEVKAYFPPGIWYNFATESKLLDSKGEYKVIPMPLDKIGVFIRGGSIVASQKPKETTAKTRRGNFTISVALDNKGSASGELFWDDGHSIPQFDDVQHNLIRFTAERGSLDMDAVDIGFERDMTAETVVFEGVQGAPTNVQVNGKPHTEFDFNQADKILWVTELGLNMMETNHIAY